MIHYYSLIGLCNWRCELECIMHSRLFTERWITLCPLLSCAPLRQSIPMLSAKWVAKHLINKPLSLMSWKRATCWGLNEKRLTHFISISSLYSFYFFEIIYKCEKEKLPSTYACTYKNVNMKLWTKGVAFLCEEKNCLFFMHAHMIALRALIILQLDEVKDSQSDDATAELCVAGRRLSFW